jgi:hypothetical protein
LLLKRPVSLLVGDAKTLGDKSMPNKEHTNWRKDRINQITGGQGVDGIHIKQDLRDVH